MVELTIKWDGEERTIEGRVATIVAWLLEREHKINGLSQGNVQFHFKGEKLRTSVQEFSENSVGRNQ